MRSNTAGALRPTCSPSRTSDVRQSSWIRSRRWRSMSSSSAVACASRNIIRFEGRSTEQLDGHWLRCQGNVKGAIPRPVGWGGARRASAAGDDAARLEEADHPGDAVPDAELVRPERDLGLERGLVRRGDAGELGDLSGAGLL